ncbi:MAG: FAD-dependent oxidoreductase [Eubacteriales bacterium]
MDKKIVVIGGVAAGPKAAARARRLDSKAEITIVEQGNFLSYAGCGMPFFIGGDVKEHVDLMCTPVGVVRDVGFFKNVKDIKVLTGTRAESIDRPAKKVVVTNLATGEESTLFYDKLVLATGSSPARPPIEGLDLKNVYTLGKIEDAIGIKEAISTGGVQKVTIIGGGMIGLELADTLREQEGRKIEVTVIELMDNILPGLLDRDMALVVEKHLKQKGVRLYTAEKVRRLEGEDRAVRRVVTDKRTVETGLVVLAAGVRPNVDLAARAGLAIGETGAIRVNEYLQTSDPDIYAGGDCVENINLVSGRAAYTPLGSVANRHGRVIGDNITIGRDTLPGVLGTGILRVFDFTVARTGLTEKEAKRVGFDPVSIIVPAPDRAHFFATSKPVIIKLIACAKTRKLLGAQITGPGDANKRIDVVAAALSMGATVDQAAVFDLAYAPPYSTAMDPLAHTANSLRNKLNGLARCINPLELKEKLDRGDNFILLDVRTPKEFQEVRLPYKNTVFIPLGKLRGRAPAELPKDREIVIFCKVSMRGYEAQLILEGLGFKDVKFMEGGIAVWTFELDTSPIPS